MAYKRNDSVWACEITHNLLPREELKAIMARESRLLSGKIAPESDDEGTLITFEFGSDKKTVNSYMMHLPQYGRESIVCMGQDNCAALRLTLSLLELAKKHKAITYHQIWNYEDILNAIYLTALGAKACPSLTRELREFSATHAIDFALNSEKGEAFNTEDDFYSMPLLYMKEESSASCGNDITSNEVKFFLKHNKLERKQLVCDETPRTNLLEQSYIEWLLNPEKVIRPKYKSPIAKHLITDSLENVFKNFNERNKVNSESLTLDF